MIDVEMNLVPGQPTTSAQLREMLEECDRFVMERFEKFGRIHAVYFVRTGDGRKLVFPRPMGSEDFDNKAVRENLERLEAVAYVWVARVWEVSIPLSEATPERVEALRSSEVGSGPGGVELIGYQGEDASGSLFGKRCVFRTEGQKPSLGPLEIIQPQQSMGEAVNLLPRQPGQRVQ